MIEPKCAKICSNYISMMNVLPSNHIQHKNIYVHYALDDRSCRVLTSKINGQINNARTYCTHGQHHKHFSNKFCHSHAYRSRSAIRPCDRIYNISCERTSITARQSIKPVSMVGGSQFLPKGNGLSFCWGVIKKNDIVSGVVDTILYTSLASPAIGQLYNSELVLHTIRYDLAVV